ncbi:MAG: PEP-CTERM sorting domain-containing protein [Planctomycetes bacterium]|nr:PEP-CTERM sorting domain-containing protein [Planctomycetota bacterium]
MKRMVLVLSTLVALAAMPLAASAADLIAYWNFNDLAITTAGPPGSSPAHPTLIGATTGTGTLSLTGFAGNIDDFTGTSVNSIPVNTPGEESLTLIPGTGLPGNGGYLQFEFSMTGLSNLGVSYATQGTSSGFNSNQWSYSTDGTIFTNFESPVVPATAYSLTGPLVTSGLDNAATAYLRYTVNGATGTGTGNNRIDNIRLESNASPPPPPNPATLPQPGDIVFGLNNSNATRTLELVRGPASASGGVKHPGPWSTTAFIQSVEFDNLDGQTHNSEGNLLGVDFGIAANGGIIYNLATQGSIPAPAGQAIGNTRAAPNNIGHDGSLTLSRLAGLSVSPDNTKIAAVGFEAGTVIVYDYTAGDTLGAGAALANGRQTPPTPLSILVAGSTQGTAWRDNNTVLAFSSFGDLYEVEATTMTPAYQVTATTDAVFGTPFIGSNFAAIAYNPDVSPYVYALYSGFSTSAVPNSQTKLYVFDPGNEYTQVADIDLSTTSQTGREMALDEDGNLFISGFDSTITFIPASEVLNPAMLTDNSSVFWYQSTSAATSFVGMDIGFSAGIPGDYNGDGKVDQADYALWAKDPDSYGGNPGGYNTWVQNFGEPSAGAGGGNGSVPEPASITMLAIGLAALCFRRRSA